VRIRERLTRIEATCGNHCGRYIVGVVQLTMTPPFSIWASPCLTVLVPTRALPFPLVPVIFNLQFLSIQAKLCRMSGIPGSARSCGVGFMVPAQVSPRGCLVGSKETEDPHVAVVFRHYIEQIRTILGSIARHHPLTHSQSISDSCRSLDDYGPQFFYARVRMNFLQKRLSPQWTMRSTKRLVLSFLPLLLQGLIL
jgi:hypothetical protein